MKARYNTDRPQDSDAELIDRKNQIQQVLQFLGGGEEIVVVIRDAEGRVGVRGHIPPGLNANIEGLVELLMDGVKVAISTYEEGETRKI